MPGKNGGLFSITGSGPIGASGKPIRVYGATLLSGGGGGGTIQWFNNTTNSGNQILDSSGTTSKAVTIGTWNSEGCLFPAGCYIQFGSNVTQVNVWAEQVVS